MIDQGGRVIVPKGKSYFFQKEGFLPGGGGGVLTLGGGGGT